MLLTQKKKNPPIFIIIMNHRNGIFKNRLIVIFFGGGVFHSRALSALSGIALPNFPISVGGKILSPIQLVNMDVGTIDHGKLQSRNPLEMSHRQKTGLSHNREDQETSQKEPSPGLHMVFPVYDGHLYIVDGRKACVSRIDIGEHR